MEVIRRWRQDCMCLHIFVPRGPNPEVRKFMKHLSILLAAALCCAGYVFGQEPGNPPPTFSKDVAPILQKHCVTCHRPGEAAPFSMLTYEQTKPWAATIKMVVTQKIMPPWYADPQYGHFANERSLSADEIRTLVAWVNSGAQKGRSSRYARVGQRFCRGLGDPRAGRSVSVA